MFGHYVDKVLQPGEQVRYRASLNWILYVPGAAVCIVALAIYMATSGWFFHAVALLVLGGGLLLLGRAWFDWWTTEIAVTDRRVIYKTGFIRRKTTEMNMEKVESVDVEPVRARPHPRLWQRHRARHRIGSRADPQRRCPA